MVIIQFSEAFMGVLEMLPLRAREAIDDCVDTMPNFEQRLNEIRLRASRPVSITLDGKNMVLPALCTAAELSQTVKLFCGGSIYAHSETLKAGYISIGNGYRVGVCGRAVLDKDKIIGISEISSVNIRIPRHIPGIGGYAEKILKGMDYPSGLLIYSRPGVGKTTLLRDLAVRLSSGRAPRRVALIDSRGELEGGGLREHCLIDVLSGYPKAAGIEIATRTLSPEFIICDEIGALDEARAILAVQSSGVPLIASAHASSKQELLLRPAIALLHESRIFGAYLGIDRRPGATEFQYELGYRDEEVRR
ncbi:MAG: hypothetical protein GX303_02960 [Clostridiales bacterium]|nr:hypothetical protein [Clostridiales bacterium]